MPSDGRRERAERVDERDTMFARMTRKPGTPQYEEYYSRRSDLKFVDDRLSRMIPLMQPGSLYYDPEVCGEADRYFEEIRDIRIDHGLVDRLKAVVLGAPDLTQGIGRILLELGAVAVGCTALDELFVYTHKGRFDEDYGKPIALDLPSVVVFLVEMDFHAMQEAPRAETLRESARQYRRAAAAALAAAATLEACGHRAKAHYDARYDVILPPLAVAAGLGEMGRNNILIANRYGSRVRIGAVTTDAPVTHDRAVSLGANAFCLICRKCADNCPSYALSLAGGEFIRGVQKWPTDVERCYQYWRRAGTDCGICMAVCPFSHPDTRLHNAVRWVVRRTSRFNRALLFLDDLVYGRDWQPGKMPKRANAQPSMQVKGG